MLFPASGVSFLSLIFHLVNSHFFLSGVTSLGKPSEISLTRSNVTYNILLSFHVSHSYSSCLSCDFTFVCVCVMSTNPVSTLTMKPGCIRLPVDPWYPVQCLTRDGHTINIYQMNKWTDLRTAGHAHSCITLVLEHSSNNICIGATIP